MKKKKNNERNKTNKKRNEVALLIVVILVIAIGFAYVKFSKKSDIVEKEYDDTKMNTILSLEDRITTDSVWCGTFNLIWNDLRNDLAKQDIVFSSQLDVVSNLNKGTFNTNYLGDDSYYKVYGHPTFELKKTIEKNIKDKFNETSDILDSFTFEEENDRDYILYVMLKKVFNFNKEFTDLGYGDFDTYSNIKYFGINSDTSDEVREQVYVYYYNNKDDFAIKISTKENDEVIIAKGIKSNSFLDIYNDIQKENDSNHTFISSDVLKVPNISFKIKSSFPELENKPFNFSNGKEYVIDKTLQTIEFELDKSGGKIKSEAGIGVKNTSIGANEKIRTFNVDSSFVLFLKEENKDLPYFATRITNITNVQTNKN